MSIAADTGTIPDWHAYGAKVLDIGRAWDAQRDPISAEPTGDTIAIASQLAAIYSPQTVPSTYTAQANLAASGTAMWTTHPGTLSYLCDSLPACIAFTSDGTLVTAKQAPVAKTGVILYSKKAFNNN